MKESTPSTGMSQMLIKEECGTQIKDMLNLFGPDNVNRRLFCFDQDRDTVYCIPTFSKEQLNHT